MAQVKTYRPSIKEVQEGGGAWSKLERAVLAATKTGDRAVLQGKENTPQDETDPDRRVRATLIRYLMLGGCDDATHGARPHPKGVNICGGWIDGILDLQNCDSTLDLKLQSCLLAHRATLCDARLGGVYLPGCHAPQGLDLHRLTTIRSVHLRDKFKATGTVDLGAARIGGSLTCRNGQFLAEGKALNCNGATIGTDVFLNRKFKAEGTVDLGGASIGGQLVCRDGQFLAKGTALNCNAATIGASVFLRDGVRTNGRVDFVRATITGSVYVCRKDGNPTHIDGIFTLQRATMDGFHWQDVAGERAEVDLRGARIGALYDDWDSWDGVKTLRLSGLRYDRLDGAMSIRQRLCWLAKAAESIDRAPEIGPSFDPQPHVQLATVLRTQGDRDGAARVLVDREHRQRRAAQRRHYARAIDLKGTVQWSLAILRPPLDWVFGLVFGYGHRPGRAFWWALALMLLAGWLYGVGYDRGHFAPNSDVILTSTEWVEAVMAYENGGDLPLHRWRNTPAAHDYETFNRWLYGVDLFLPLDTLGQEVAWHPSTAYGGWGAVLFYARGAFQMAGWIITALAAAVLTGLVGRRD